MKNIKSEVVVVTGGSRGIGAAISKLAAHRGWKVCINYKSNGKNKSKNKRDR